MFVLRPAPSLIVPRILLVALLLLGTGLAHAQPTPTVGLYWNTSYDQTEVAVDAFPTIMTGYLVLRGVPEGILGWELAADIEGDATIMGWSFEGGGIPVNTYPNHYIYGLSTPLPDTPDGILLGSIQVMVDGPRSTTVELKPPYRGGLTGEMAYLSADDPDVLRIMTTPTGAPAVAFINPEAPWYDIEPSGILFGEQGLDTTVVRELAVTNVGGSILELDVSLPPDCTAFSLPGLSGPMGLAAGETRIIEVGFRPTAVETYSCNLIMGGIVPDVVLHGSGRPPITSWARTESVNFGTVVVGYSAWKSVTVQNTGEVAFPVEPALDGTVAGLSITSGGDPVVLEPGEQVQVGLTYEPLQTATFVSSLSLGDVVEPTHLYGGARQPVTSWSITPVQLSFNPTAVGDTREAKVTIRNTGDTPISGDVQWQGDHEGFEIFSGLGPFTLYTGQSRYVWVRFSPANLFNYTGTIEIGPGYQPVPVDGVGSIYSEECDITPTALEFGSLNVNYSLYKTFQVNNPGTAPLTVDPTVNSPHFSFSTSSPGAKTLQPGESAWYTVKFRPQWAGEHTATVDPGTGFCPEVLLTGRGLGTEAGCVVVPDTLRFGPVVLGETVSQLMHVDNTGDVAFDLAPEPTSAEFAATGGVNRLIAGQSTNIIVTFTPTEAGLTEALLNIGGVCQPVVLIGNAVTGFETWENQIGIYFDENYGSSEIATSIPNQEVMGYLVLHNPSESSGVGAYELQAKLTGPGTILGWEFQGNYINVGSYNELIVGIGGTPLVPDPSGAVLLATVRMVVFEPFPSEVTLQLGPIYNATLPGLMAWVPWHDAELVLPMLPSSGIPTVSWINNNALPAEDVPAPLAVLSDRTVRLQWPRPDGGDGFHVYRREGDETARRLTELPLRPGGATVDYTDDVAGFAPGTVLRYSYALLDDGAETLRSPETEVTVGGLPVLANRLLPNVPNPFNPSTEVHFELKSPGRVRVAVYGMNGRLVRTLVDGDLGAGPHHRVWDGRDDTGRQVASGAYYLRLETDEAIDHRKMMLLK